MTNAAGTALSEPLRIEIIPAPVPWPVLTVPFNPTEGGSFAVTGYPGNTTAPVTYQWYFEGKPLSGENGPMLQRSPVSTSHVGEYFVAVSNEEGVGLSGSYKLNLAAMSASSADWIRAEEHGGVIYFLFADTPRIERFECASRSWLTTWTLPETPRSFAFTPTGLFIAFAKTVVRYSRDFTDATPFTTTVNTIDAIGVLRGHVVVITLSPTNQTAARLVRISDGATLSDQAGTFPHLHVHFDEVSGRMVGAAGSSSVLGITLNEGLTWTDLTFHHTLDISAQRLWLVGRGDRFVTGNGTVRDTRTGLALTSAGGMIDGFVSDGSDGWLALRPDSVARIDAQWRETGRRKIARRSRALWQDGDEVLIFARPVAGARPVLEVVSRSSIVAPSLSEPAVSWTVVPSPAVTIGSDDTVYISSRIHGSVLRWSPHGWRYLRSLPLAGNPSTVTPVDAHGVLYYPHQNAYVRRGALDSGGAEPFGSAVHAVYRLAGAGAFLVVEEGNEGLHSRRLRTVNAQGVTVGTHEYSGARDLQWCAGDSRLYWVGDYGSYRVGSIVVNEDGTFGAALGNNDAVNGHAAPLRVAGNGSYLVTGDGAIFDGGLSTKRGQIVTPFVDAAWVSDALVIAREHLNGTRLTRQAFGTWPEEASVVVPGRPVRLLTLSDGRLLLVTHLQSVLAFRLLDPATLSAMAPQVDFGAWRAASFTSAELAIPALTGAAADYAGDGVANLLKFALGIDPAAPAQGLLGEIQGSATEWVYRYRRAIHAVGMKYVVESSTDLQQWDTESLVHAKIAEDGDFEVWEARLIAPASRAFFRLKVTRE